MVDVIVSPAHPEIKFVAEKAGIEHGEKRCRDRARRRKRKRGAEHISLKCGGELTRPNLSPVSFCPSAICNRTSVSLE